MKNTCAKIHRRGWASGPQALMPRPPPGRGDQACGAHMALPPPIPALFIPFHPEKNQERRIHCVSRSRGAATSRSWPTWLCRPQFQRYLFPFIPKKIKREEFIAFHDPEAPPHPVLALEGRSGVRFGIRIKEIVAIVIINLLPSPIP